MPFPLGGHDGCRGGCGLGDELDGVVEGCDGAHGGGGRGAGGLQQDEGVGRVLLAEGPGLVVGGPEQAGGGRGLEAQDGRAVGLEEGEQLRGQLEQPVGGGRRGVVEGDAGDGLAGEHGGWMAESRQGNALLLFWGSSSMGEHGWDCKSVVLWFASE